MGVGVEVAYRPGNRRERRGGSSLSSRKSVGISRPLLLLLICPLARENIFPPSRSSTIDGISFLCRRPTTFLLPLGGWATPDPSQPFDNYQTEVEILGQKGQKVTYTDKYGLLASSAALVQKQMKYAQSNGVEYWRHTQG